jgi:16S rRNA (guanine966-N2)-methyltransferase
VFSSLTRLGIRGDAFDFIFADPPFKELLREKIVQTVDRNRVLKTNGFLIVEHGFRDPDPLDHGLQLLKQKHFGDSVVTVYGYTGFAS